MNNAYNNYLMIITDFSTVLRFVDICSLEANGGRVSEIVCLPNRNIFNAHRIDCLVDRKGIGIESVIVSNFSQSRTHCSICFNFCSRKIGACCTQIWDIVRQIYLFKNSIVSE